jgi:tetratricopeptide (TPR) repeat protein
MTKETFGKICIELGTIACQRGDYALTYILYNKGFSDPDTATQSTVASTLLKVGTMYAEQKKYKQASRLYKKAQAIYRSMPQVDNEGLRNVLDQLAELYRQQGKYFLATQTYEQAMAIDKSANEKDLERIQYRTNQLMWLYLRQGDFEAAGDVTALNMRLGSAQFHAH